MKLIGITGGIGAGKSEILSYIGSHYNCRIELADLVAHQVKEPGEECYHALTELLGEEILNRDGRICREKMAAVIFKDSSLLQKVNGIIHPAVKKYFLKEIQKERLAGKYDYFFIEAALLIEEGYAKIVDELWYIYTREDIRRERLHKSRGYSEEKIDGIMRGQLSEEEFRKHCAFVIDNNSSLEGAIEQIDRKLGRKHDSKFSISE